MDIKDYTISPHISVKDAIRAIDYIGKKAVLIIDKDNTLLGIFTDGDMRRYILKNGDLSVAVEEVMNRHPIVFESVKEAEEHKVYSKMVVYPVVNGQNQLIDIIFWNDGEKSRYRHKDLEQLKVVIMAGGKGTRLYPYTKILPKPLIPIGDKTITERIVENFLDYGCTDFKLVLNYKASMIKAYFNDLEKEYTVSYVEEEKFLGTGGGLSLLKGELKETFFVSNCDVLIDANYAHIYKMHKENKNKMTIVCALKNVMVPYGVISLGDGGDVKEMIEKPSLSFLTNTGLYLLEPEVLEDIEEGVFVHITDLIKRYIEKGEAVGVYPISEKSWLDMGQLSELENMFQSLGVKP